MATQSESFFESWAWWQKLPFLLLCSLVFGLTVAVCVLLTVKLIVRGWNIAEAEMDYTDDQVLSDRTSGNALIGPLEDANLPSPVWPGRRNAVEDDEDIELQDLRPAQHNSGLGAATDDNGAFHMSITFPAPAATASGPFRRTLSTILE
ncbi:MAG: hypothetical protein M1817_001672 [Caeruleum heppii]|nr:MAG: hypothetical protein M1817_001672 [Caeruleum heppii]